jgi:methionine-S-sulfoxide reductase
LLALRAPIHKLTSWDDDVIMRTNWQLAIVAVVVHHVCFVGLLSMAQAQPSAPAAGKPESPPSTAPSDAAELETATLGSGCFWCTEAVFDRLKGVKSAVSGYSGGNLPRPTYEQVSSGTTGHAEVVQVTFDPALISFADLLRVFWQTHDPTTPNRQGHDIGPQYRSAIFYHTDRQRKTAEQYKRQLEASGTFKSPIVTEITRYTEFFPAEKYHQDYFELNPSQRYCSLVIQPKIEKFEKEFKKLLRNNARATEARQP